MSPSKEEPRLSKCARCRHHGVLTPKKGHTKSCPFLRCDCWKCSLSTQRTRITAAHRDVVRDGQGRERRRRAGTGASGANGSSSGSTPERGARSSAPSGPPERAAQDAGGPSHSGEFGQTAPLPVVHFPFWMPGYYPGGYSAPPHLLFTMPGFPPVPAGLYSGDLCGPMMFPHFQQGVVDQPPPPEPGAPAAGFYPLAFSLENFQEVLMSAQRLQPPLPNNAEHDGEERDPRWNSL
ncbi:doublesex and mab-3 related transcription factor 1-like [Stegastes partitus]|uniref:Doublesex and mab-3 related transcription factor 1-like n=1 Tax=Stegastes partitus TaxID=144197 RepID=A0A9Y4KB31_9TELE|nr:PREDICTED: doublesex and mab-3 related transcription factor 1-like [Stegastes partitus]